MGKPDPNETVYYENILSIAHEGVVVVDHEGIIIWVNAAFTQITGYREHDILGKPFYILVSRDQTVQKFTSRNPLINFYNTEKKAIDLTFFDNHGHGVSVRFRSLLIKNNHGQVKQAIGMIEHLSERSGTNKGGIRHSEKIHESQQYLENVLEHSADAIAISDNDGNITLANKAFSHLLDYAHEELIGRHITEFTAYEEGTYVSTTGDRIVIDKESVNAAAMKPAELFEKGYVSNWNPYLVKKDKVHVPTDITMSVLKDTDGEWRGSIIIIRDITEKKIAEKEVREARDFLESIIENSMDGIAICDDKGQILSINSALEQMSVFTREELRGEHISKLTIDDKDFKRSLLEKAEELIEKGFSSQKSMLQGKDDKMINVECNTSMIKDSKGDYIAGVSIMRDITEREKAVCELRAVNIQLKASEQQLRAAMQQLEASTQQLIASENEVKESRDFLENVFNTSADGVMVTDNQGCIIKVNKSLEKMLGYQAEDLIGKYTPELGPRNEETIEERSKAFDRLFEEGHAESWEAEWYRNDGSLCPIEINVSLLRDNDGNFSGVLGGVRDITKRKIIEEERIRLSSAVEQAAETVVIMGSDGTTHYINPATENLTGYKSSEILGQNLFLTERGVYSKEFYQGIWESVSMGNVWKGHITYKKKDGGLCEFEQTISPIRDNSGNIINFVAIGRDVTNEMRLEKHLQQSQKIEAIGTLAGGIAHDFNNILAAIIGYTEMSLIQRPTGNRVIYNLEQVLKSCKRAKDLVNQILTFSRKSDQELKPLQIDMIIKEAVKLLRASIPTTIDIRQKIDTNSGIVMADTIQIHQVVMNLCMNAAYAMQEKGGVLEIGLSLIYFDSEEVKIVSDIKPGHYVKLTVSDTGFGMEDNIINKIFDPFFTTKGPGKGTGMGLSVVHGIVKAHGGTVNVYSETGKGSTFSVYLPKIEEEVIDEDEILKPPPTGTEKIMFVDDEDELIYIARETIESLGYTVTAKKSSIEALNEFREDPGNFDLVITDYTMPDMTGYELAGELLKIRPDIPIILCTGFSEMISTEKAKETGIREFIIKPINRITIATVIRDVLDNEG